MRKLMGMSALVVVAILGGGAACSAAAYQEAPVSNGGSISGKVLLGGAEVESETYPITKDHVSCGTGTRTVEWVRANADALLDVVVYLDGVKAGKPFPEESKAVVVDQVKCYFVPYVQVMANGAELTALNSDANWHSVHIYEMIGDKRRTLFNFSQPQSALGITKNIALRRGDALKFECDAHEYMHGWVFVARNPYYAIVDENGAFTIGDVPPGKYVVKSWHGRLGEREAEIEVQAGSTSELEFSY